MAPREPTFNTRPTIFVDSRDREDVFKNVARAVSAFREILPCYVPSRKGRVFHSVTRKPLTEEWLFEYLGKAIDFQHLYEEQGKDGQVPEWLPRMIVERGSEFSEHMWCGIY